MDSVIAGIPWFIVSILPLIIGILFTLSFKRTQNESKLIFALAYTLSSLTFLPQINPEWKSIAILESLHLWGALPIITAITLVSINFLKKIPSKILKSTFYFSIIITIFMTITSIQISPSFVFQIISIITISCLTIQFIRRRTLSSLIFLSSILFFK